MEFLKRKIKSEGERNNNNMHCSLIDGVRLSLRWIVKEDNTQDILVNLTRAETKLIANILKNMKVI